MIWCYSHSRTQNYLDRSGSINSLLFSNNLSIFWNRSAKKWITNWYVNSDNALIPSFQKIFSSKDTIGECPNWSINLDKLLISSLQKLFLSKATSGESNRVHHKISSSQARASAKNMNDIIKGTEKKRLALLLRIWSDERAKQYLGL